LPVPTTRLEALRRGFEDYQYLLLLDQACRRNLLPREKQELISAKLRHLTDNLPRSTFPVSMDELEEMRLNIGEILDGVNGSEEAQENPPAAQPQAHIRQEEAAR